MFPILFQSGPVKIYSYGVFTALAVTVAWFASARRAKTCGLPADAVTDLVFLMFVTGVFGARVFFVFQHLEIYRRDPGSVFAFQEGGLVWYGGFFTAAAGGALFAGWKKQPIPKLCDLFAPILPLAQALGRVGCFLNGCCYGRVTTSPLGLVFPGELARRHPTQLYEAAFLLMISWTLFRVPIKKEREGRVLLLYLALYGAARFFVEFFRGDQTMHLFLTLPQWISAGLSASALFFLLRKKDRARI